MLKRLFPIIISVFATFALAAEKSPEKKPIDFKEGPRDFLEKYCIQCHGGEKAEDEIDFKKILETNTVSEYGYLWADVADTLEEDSMPPEEETLRHTVLEAHAYLRWFRDNFTPKPQS
ncbi:MAG: hypothetical protein AAGB46_18700 [Verrucomicrobiota bacterium]